MSYGFVKADVADDRTGKLIYSGRIAYMLGDDVSEYDEEALSDVFYKYQNVVDFMALDSDKFIDAGDVLERDIYDSNGSFLMFDVNEVIDKNNREYQDCLDSLNAMNLSPAVIKGELVDEPELESSSDLSWEDVDKKTLWVARFDGHRRVDTYAHLEPFLNGDDLRDVDVLTWEAQPKEVQGFYKAYNYALYDMNRRDLFYLQDFYNEWSKDPNQFMPKHYEPIGRLSDYLSNLNPSDDLIVSNYYGLSGAGNHRVGCFIEALNKLNMDFDVIKYDGDANHIYIQTDNFNALDDFSREANDRAIAHSAFMGDGKYEKSTYDKKVNMLNRFRLAFGADEAFSKEDRWNVFRNISEKNISKNSFNGMKAIRIFDNKNKPLSVLVSEKFIKEAGNNSVGNKKFDVVVPKWVSELNVKQGDMKDKVSVDKLLDIHNDSLERVSEYMSNNKVESQPEEISVKEADIVIE